MGLLDRVVNAEEHLYQPTFLEWAVLQTQPLIYQRCKASWQGVLSTWHHNNGQGLRLHVGFDDSVWSKTYLHYHNEEILNKVAEHLWNAVWSHLERDKPVSKNLLRFAESWGRLGIAPGFSGSPTVFSPEPDEEDEEELEDDDIFLDWADDFPYAVDYKCTPKTELKPDD